MINKIAESHFNALRASLDSSTEADDVANTETNSAHEALDTFLSTPSFSNKQVAIESLLNQFRQAGLPS